MTAPGVGVMTALSFVAAIGDPDAFRSGRTVAAWIGLTQRRFQSGKLDLSGRISRHGDKLVRTCYLYEAATHVLTRSREETALKRRAEGLRARVGFKKATVALARKLAVELHAMWASGIVFKAGVEPTPATG